MMRSRCICWAARHATCSFAASAITSRPDGTSRKRRRLSRISGWGTTNRTRSLLALHLVRVLRKKRRTFLHPLLCALDLRDILQQNSHPAHMLWRNASSPSLSSVDDQVSFSATSISLATLFRSMRAWPSDNRFVQQAIDFTWEKYALLEDALLLFEEQKFL